MTTEEELNEKLLKMKENGLKDINFYFTEDRTRDQRQEAALEALFEMEKWDALTEQEQMQIQIRQSYQYLNKVIGLCQTNFKEPYDLEEAKRLSKIFCGIESAMMLLSNWIHHEEIQNIRASRHET